MSSAISISNISKSIQTKNKVTTHILQNISIDIKQSEVFGFIGPNGAGKTTTIKLLLNFTKPDSGTIKIFDHIIGRDEFRHCIGYLSELPFFYEHLTAFETLLLAGRLSGVTDRHIKIRIPSLLAKMNLSDASDKPIKSFSKGMKQRLGMATSLIHDPQILIFDEPMSGLDPLGRHLLKTIFHDLKEKNKTIFFSSHILSDIEDLCDRIGVIHKGRLIYTGDISTFTKGTNKVEEAFVAAIKEADQCNNG